MELEYRFPIFYIKEHVHKLTLAIQTTLNDFKSSDANKKSRDVLNSKLLATIGRHERDVKQDMRLQKSDVDILLMNVEFQKNTISNIVDFAASGIPSNSSGRIEAFWDNVWAVVIVIIAVAIVGAAIGAIIVFSEAALAGTLATSAAAITAASFTGFWVGASFGTIWGAVEVFGYNQCPASCWWQDCFPLTEWQTCQI